MTLYGKIISIKCNSPTDWHLVIDDKHKQFYTYQALHAYLIHVLKKGKDQEKLELLRQDMKHLIQNCENLLDNKK